ncbi:MAG: CCA tRNA nucleotidyltransferase [Fibrobacter sp.]|nr:CCA tRNA nucleotidyltransferase [Fibrobacter sp.]
MRTIQTLSGVEFEPDLPHRLLTIADEIRAAGGRAYLVGGWVRDAMLGGNCRDYDIEVYDMEQDVLIAILSKFGRTNLVGKAFGVIHLAMKGLSLDFSFPRTESKVGYGHRGFVVHTDAKLTFREAALRRDFTINAMGMELPDLTLCDPYNGVEDLKAGVLRHVGPAFAEDSLRILRGVQFASRFRLRLAPETVEMCRTLSLDDLSIERLFEEFKKWLLKPGKPSLGLRAFLEIKLDEYFPEIRPLAGRWDALGELLDYLSSVTYFTDEERMVAMFTALLAGNAVQSCELDAGSGNDSCAEDTALKFLARITNEIKLVRGVPLLLKHAFSVKAPSGSIDSPSVRLPSDPEIRRLSVALNGLRLLIPFVEGNPLEDSENRKTFAAALKQRSMDLGVYEKAPVAYLTGKMLMDLGVKPGKQMGDLIKQSFELQLDGKILNASDAMGWARGALDG